ncbi:MAG: hypothetical protein ACKVXR_04820 [Planctomycetota bacterium]
MTDAEPPLRSERQRLIREWLNRPPELDLDAELSSSGQARRLFLQELADRVAPALNERLLRTSQETYEEKKALARWVNKTLRELDLAVECPRTGMPAAIATYSSQSHKGSFQLQVTLPDGKTTHSRSASYLSNLRLTARDIGMNPPTRWHSRHGSNDEAPSR